MVLLLILGTTITCKHHNKSDYIKMITRGPGSCVDILVLDQDGNGRLTRGISKDDYKEEFKELATIKIDKEFKITSSKAIDILNKKIDSIGSKNHFKGNFAWDGKHTEIYVNGVKKIDVYGFKNRDQIELYMQLIKYLPYDYNTFCN